ncbi:hypothetical protein V6Z12_D11G263100 [Gossypium hirsutum]
MIPVEFDYIGAENDPESFSRSMSGKKLELWYSSMKEEINFMKSKDIKDCSPSVAPIVKSDKFNLNHLMYAKVIDYSNSDFFGYVDSHKLTLGCIFMFAGEAISWRSVNHAEFISCFEDTSHGVCLKSFIFGLGLVGLISRSLMIYCDYSTIVFMAKNKKAIRECVKEKKVVIDHINTKQMSVDPLTKDMSPHKFKDHVVTMRLVPTL